MSFAALRRLRRRFGLSNSQRLVEARKFLLDDLAPGPQSSSAGRSRRRGAAAAGDTDSGMRADLEWARALSDRSARGYEPTDDEVEKFFRVGEKLYGADLATPLDPRSLIGRIVGARYVVEELIGEGAAGVVYRARHIETDASVALKVLHPSKVLRREIIGDLDFPRRFWDELVARFRREAKAAAKLHHPGLVSVFDFGAEGSGFYQAMEFLSGETLKDLMEREAPMPVARAVGLAHEAADALDAAHRLGVVHRDLKPANLFLCKFDWGEKLKVLDFGIAKIVREAESEATRLTETGVFLGTYRYASPEQCMGETVTPASDVYSLAVTLFEMLAGRSPFDGPSSVLAIRHATTPAPRVEEFRSDVPEGLGDVVDRALAKQPSRRPASGGELAAALAPYLGRSGAVSRPPEPRVAPRRRVPADALANPTSHAPLPRPGSGTVLHGAPAVASAGKDPRTFSDLLVRELLQYYPNDVAEGKKSRDLYRRLRNEIDIRWSLYAKRFPEEPADHFYERLVETLAGGDVELFGPGFPSSTERRRRRLQGR
jgi:serine/threonine protein kinase